MVSMSVIPNDRCYVDFILRYVAYGRVLQSILDMIRYHLVELCSLASRVFAPHCRLYHIKSKYFRSILKRRSPYLL